MSKTNDLSKLFPTAEALSIARRMAAATKELSACLEATTGKRCYTITELELGFVMVRIKT